MHILYFLKVRTRFIRHYYETAAEPFREMERKIEMVARLRKQRCRQGLFQTAA